MDYEWHRVLEKIEGDEINDQCGRISTGRKERLFCNIGQEVKVGMYEISCGVEGERMGEFLDGWPVQTWGGPAQVLQDGGI